LAVRSALGAAEIPTYAGGRAVAEHPHALKFVLAPGRVPLGRRVYAIGDVHGHRDKVCALHDLIQQDLTNRPVQNGVLIHLGDYINQGPDSAGVLDHLIALRLPGLRVINLLGDHERLLLDAIDGDRAAATDWLWAGGQQALASWHLPADLPRDAFAAAFPPDHVAFLRSLVLTHQEGDYLFVHAGLRPGVPLKDQSRDDQVMIRQPFLSTEAPFGPIVVHGHSSTPQVPILSNRIGLDTGAGIGGRLTCAVFEEDGIALLAV
jgi:serine/threonine protein phosphatase 1